MPTHVVYDEESGQPIHTHIEPEGHRSSKEEILARVPGDVARKKMNVVLVDEHELVRMSDARIEIATRALTESKGKVGGLGGGGMAGPAQAPPLPPHVRTHIDGKRSHRGS